MRARAPFASLVAALLASLAGCGEEERSISGWDQLDSRYRSDCAPNGDEAVLHAWKGGKRYCFRYTIERMKPRDGSKVIIAQNQVTLTN